jgi:hypothetical protein
LETLFVVGPLQSLKNATEFMLEDDGFQLQTPLATSAYSCAQQLKVWLAEEQNNLHAEKFSSTLVKALQGCFHHTGCSFKLQHERLCENFFKLKSSHWYIDLWTKFLYDAIRREACPIFFQAITDTIMDKLTKEHFPVAESMPLTPEFPIDKIERNAIRYMAGYVIHSLKKKVCRRSHPMNEEIMLCLSELEENEIGG